MSQATFEGSNLEAALERAAEKIGAPAEELDYEVVEEKTDFWGLSETVVTIRAWPRTDETEADEEDGVPVETEEADEPVETPAEEAGDDGASGGFWDADGAQAEAAAGEEAGEAAETAEAEVSLVEAAVEEEQPSTEPPASIEATEGELEDPTEAIVELLDQIIRDMDFDCTVEVESQAEGYLAAIGGADKELLVEGHGRCLSALELILNNVFRHKLPSGQKVRVDAGDFRSRREEELTDLAYQVAHSAKQSGETQETQPLNPYERRLVHLALAEDGEVSTRSRGSGFLKNVQVIPRVDNRGGGRNSRSRGRKRGR